MVDASERLQVLLTQEQNIYRTSDYLSRMQNDPRPLLGDVAPSDDTESSPASPNKKRKSQSNLENASRDMPPPGQGAHDENSATDASTNSQINKHWREKICEWAYQVVDHFDLHREVVSIAMSHLDRYLASFQATVDKNMFQLLAMTCLYLSVKLNEYKHLLIPGSKSSMDTILQLSRGFFTLEQMEKMEYDILQRLRWHVHPPTPQLFTKHFLFFMSIEEHEIHDLAQFMVELSVMDYFFVSFKPSEIAIAGILNAMDKLRPEGDVRLNFPFNKTMLDVDSPEISACRQRLALIFAQAHDQATSESAIQILKGNNTQRTTSPVSVMTPIVVVLQHADGSMDIEDDDEL